MQEPKSALPTEMKNDVRGTDNSDNILTKNEIHLYNSIAETGKEIRTGTEKNDGSGAGIIIKSSAVINSNPNFKNVSRKNMTLEDIMMK